MRYGCGLCDSILEAMRRLSGTSIDYQFTVYWSVLELTSPCRTVFQQVIDINTPNNPSYDQVSPYFGIKLNIKGVESDLTSLGPPPECLRSSACLLDPDTGPDDPTPCSPAFFGQNEIEQSGPNELLSSPCDATEDWGSAAAYVARLHPWRETPCQARRFFIPISDEAPRCGGKVLLNGFVSPICDDAPATTNPPYIGGPDWRITREASECAIAERMWIMPIVGCFQCNPCIECPGCALPCRDDLPTVDGPPPCPPEDWQETCVEPTAQSCNVASCVQEQARLFSYYTTGIVAFSDDPLDPNPPPPGIGTAPYLVHPTFTRRRSDANPWIDSITDFISYRIAREGCRTTCESIDFNRDGLYPADEDLIDFLTVLAGGTCSNHPVCGTIDFDADCLFPEDDDLIVFLARLAGQPCGGGGG